MQLRPLHGLRYPMSSVFPRPLVLASLLAGGGASLYGCHRDYDDAVTTWHRNATSLTHAIPATDAEREALARAPEVAPSRTVVVLGNETATFGDVYASASGRSCRALGIESMTPATPATERLICAEGESWVLVPDLLERGTGDGPEDEL